MQIAERQNDVLVLHEEIHQHIFLLLLQCPDCLECLQFLSDSISQELVQALVVGADGASELLVDFMEVSKGTSFIDSLQRI